MKKFITLLCALALTCGCSASTSNSTSTTAASTSSSFTPGTYTGVGEGRNKKLTVEVTLSSDAITDIKITDHGETPVVSDAAIEKVPQEIIDNQSLDVDVATGATMTSNAIISAVKNALASANVDASSLNSKTTEYTPKTETLEADLVIVGGGATGAMAAAQAAGKHPDKKVILVEQNSYIGGNAVVSGGYIGIVNAPEDVAAEKFDGANEMIESIINQETDDEFKKELIAEIKRDYEKYKKGDQTHVFQDSALGLYDYYNEFPIEYNHELFKKSFAKTDDVFYWFYDQGAKFAKMIGVTGYSYPSSTYLEDYYSGAGYFTYFNKAFEGYDNLTIMLSTQATSIITEDGKATGIEAKSTNGDEYTINATNVILAFGGYATDTEKVKEDDTYFGDLIPERLLTDNVSSTDSQGIKMAEAIGAQIDTLGFAQFFPLANPITGECHDIIGMDGLLVTDDRKRVVDESSDRQTLTKAIYSQPDKYLWLVSDSVYSWINDGVNMFGQDVQTMIDRGYLYKADTLEELAELTGINKENLVETVNNFNAFVNGDQEDEMGRLTNDGPMTEGSYYAQKRTAVSHITYGGIVRDDNMQVLDTNNNPIGNLYVVGDAAISFGGINDMTESVLLIEELYGE